MNKQKYSAIKVKRKKHYIVLSLCIGILILGAGLILMRQYSAIAATYQWMQSGWEGGVDTVNYPSHPDNQSSWTKYYEKAEGIQVGTEVQLQQLPGTSVQTSDTDFAAGQFTDTAVDGAGDSAKITLD